MSVRSHMAQRLRRAMMRKHHDHDHDHDRRRRRRRRHRRRPYQWSLNGLHGGEANSCGVN